MGDLPSANASGSTHTRTRHARRRRGVCEGEMDRSAIAKHVSPLALLPVGKLARIWYDRDRLNQAGLEAQRDFANETFPNWRGGRDGG